MRDDPCHKCGAYDWYYRGSFSYCRPCHAEAQKRYMERKKHAEEVQVVKPPSKTLHSQDFSQHSGRRRLACKNGHPVNAENTRMSSQRGGKDLFRRCRVCERNTSRVKYGLPVEAAPVKLSELLDQIDS